MQPTFFVFGGSIAHLPRFVKGNFIFPNQFPGALPVPPVVQPHLPGILEQPTCRNLSPPAGGPPLCAASAHGAAAPFVEDARQAPRPLHGQAIHVADFTKPSNSFTISLPFLYFREV